MYLFTAPNSNMIGLYYLPLPIVAHETGLTMEQVTAALAELAALDVAKYDEDSELVYLPAMARFQVGDEIPATNKNLIKGIIRELERFERHAFGVDFIARYNEAFHLGKPLGSPLQAPSKGGVGTEEPPSKGGNGVPETPSRSGSGSGTGSGNSQGAGDQTLPVQAIGHADPLTISGLIAVVTGAVTRNHSEIGVYNQGRWAYDRAERFLAAIPPDKRTDATRAEIRARAEAFAKSTEPWLTGGIWTVEKFCENYAALARANAPPPPRESSAQAAAKRLAAAGGYGR